MHLSEGASKGMSFLPNWLRRHKDLSIGLGIYALFALGTLVIWNSHPTYIPISSSASEMTIPNLAPSGTPLKEILLSIGGVSNQSTQSFRTTGKWAVTYSYNDCSSPPVGSRIFSYSVENSGGTVDTDYSRAPVSSGGVTTDYYSDAGEHYLAIKSYCYWTISAEQ